MKLNWCEKEEDHKNSIPADILYLSKRWCNKSKKLLIVGNCSKYKNNFNHLNITCWNLQQLINKSNKFGNYIFDYILCYHSLSELHFQECRKILSFLSNILNQNGEIYLTLLSKDSYFFKHNIRTDNNLYVNQKELATLLNPFKIKNIEYTKRLKPDKKNNPHYYILASSKK